MELRIYQDNIGNAPFQKWFERLDANAASRVSAALVSLKNGSTGNVKSIGQGVHEVRIHQGPGYRIYFGYDGLQLVILLGGGTKRRQSQDILQARKRWKQYRILKEN